MRIGILIVAVVAGMSAAGTALAADPAPSGAADPVPSGIEAGLRTGYALGLGNMYEGGAMSDGIGSAVPLWVDAGYRFANPNLFVGAYFQYGIGFAAGVEAKNCSTSHASCSFNILRYGIQAQYHILPTATFDPWVGLGIGLENANSYANAGGQEQDGHAHGVEFVILQAGADYHVLPALGVGPFVSLGFSQYGGYSTQIGSQTSSVTYGSGGAPPPSLHEWLTFGVRGVYDIGI
jgi:hypothetical protein